MKDNVDTQNRIENTICTEHELGEEAVEMAYTDDEDYSWLVLDDFDDNN
ncbi:MAG: hypothetical protein J6N53_14885 [Lachnospiraceae bacterium]|nr:hypothetical protein [Lachnospiraceae bacterium]